MDRCRFSSDTMVMPVEFTLKMFTFSDKKPLVNTYMCINGDEAGSFGPDSTYNSANGKIIR